MNYIEMLLLYLHYLSIPFRLLLIIIVYFIGLIIAALICNNTAYYNVLLYSNSIFMRCININKIYDENDINKLNDYVDSDEKFIVIFNHTNLVEPFLLYSVYPKFSIVLNHTIPSTIPFFNIIKEKLNYIYTEKDKTTENIIEYTKNRKKGDSVLMIAPSGGKVSDDPNNRITKFRSGAFVGKFPILPIVIKFDNNIIDYNHDKGESFIQAVLKIFLHQKYNVKIKVLDMMYPLENEEINDYKDRAHQLMSKEYATL